MSLQQLHDSEIESHRKYYRTIALLYFTLGLAVGGLLTLLFF